MCWEVTLSSVSHQRGREFRLLYLWLKAMLSRVSHCLQREPSGWHSLLLQLRSARGTKPSNARDVTRHGVPLKVGRGGLTKVQHGMWILCCRVDRPWRAGLMLTVMPVDPGFLCAWGYLLSWGPLPQHSWCKPWDSVPHRGNGALPWVLSRSRCVEPIFLEKIGVARGCENPPHRPIWDPNVRKCHKVRNLPYLNKLLAVFAGLGSRTVSLLSPRWHCREMQGRVGGGPASLG